MMITIVNRISSLFFIFLLTAVNLYAQHADNIFSKQKGKKNLPENTSFMEEQVIDGSLYRSTIFNSSPLLQINDPHHKVVYAQGSQVPIWIETKYFQESKTARMFNAPLDINAQCTAYLKSISKLTKISNPSEEFEIISVQKNADEVHVKLKQKYKGIFIFGSEVCLHFNKNGSILNGRYVPTPNLSDVSPVVSEKLASETVIKDLQQEGKYRELSESEKKLLEYNGPSSELIFFKQDMSSTKLILSWRIEARPNMLDHWIYFIDALNGKIIEKSNHTCNAGPIVSTATDLNGVSKTFGTYQVGSTYYMIDASKPMFNLSLSSMPDNPVGTIWTIDANNTDITTWSQLSSISANSWNSKSVSAHANADSCFKYYSIVHSRNSLDDQGGTIISVINVTQGGQQMDNAYWNGKLMAYGNGSGFFKPLAGGLDVAAHEMTHGVIQKTANLTYQGQSGAINESMADIFGCMVDKNDWHIGEDVMGPSSISFYPTGYLRDLSNPHNGGTSSSNPSWQPNHMSEFIFTSNDRGGVHTNSGIPNYAFYLFSTAVTKAVSEKVYYKALTDYLSASSQFIDLRLAVVQAATDLYPSDASIANAAKTAFDQVGITDGTGTPISNDLPVNPGTDFILMQGLDVATNSLYKVAPDLSSFPSISTRKIGNKTSITDNGSTAYFVDINGRIIKKSMTTPYSEIVFDNSKIWDNVAVSKDGLRLAAVTNDIDSSIYIRQVSGGGWTRFKLYNPTFSSGVTTAGPQYADALEWDYTGEVLMYDCYNLLTGSGSEDIDYWNIGFINVWNKTSNTLGDGAIKNLFDGLPEYISIGNPTFSKNSPNVVAFDFIDFSDNSCLLVGANTETGAAGYVLDLDMQMLGYPSYSKNDNQVAFTSFSSGDTTIFTININSDKINYTSYASITALLSNVKIPVWYATGTRVLLGVQNSTSVLSEMNTFPNPFTDEVNIEITLKNSGDLTIEIFNMFGQQIKTLIDKNETAGEHSYAFSLSDLQNGTYIIKAKTSQEVGVVKIMKVK